MDVPADFMIYLTYSLFLFSIEMKYGEKGLEGTEMVLKPKLQSENLGSQRCLTKCKGKNINKTR